MRCLRLLSLLFALTTCVLSQSTPPPKNSAPFANWTSSAPVVDTWIQQALLSASNGEPFTNFGYSVAMDGNTAVVGVPFGSNSQQGAAYVFVQDGTTWTQQAELTASDGQPGDYFGWSVAISGGTVVVGAFSHLGAGAAYVFVQNGATWTQQAELSPSDGVGGGYFGWSVSVSGSTAMVGAPFDTAAGYLFVQNGTTWTQQAELTAPSGGDGDYAGWSVAISGGTAFLAVPWPNGSELGVVYVFAQNGTTWTQQAALTASDELLGDGFGESVAVSGSTVVVGSSFHPWSKLSAGPGAAYVFAGSGGTWSQQAELTPSNGSKDDDFGTSVAITGGTAVVGAPCHPAGAQVCLSEEASPGSGYGAAYVFAQSGSTWSQQAELTASDATPGDHFGVSVAASGSTILSGSPVHTVGLNAQQGATYVYGPGVPAYTVLPVSLNFANQAVNSTSPIRTVTLKNTSTSTLGISNISMTVGTNFVISSKTCGSSLAAGKPCTVNVTFTPTKLGALTDTLSFTLDSPNSPQTVPLLGSGIVQASVSPSSYTFPRTTVDNTSPPRSFTLWNHLPTTLSGISYSTAAPFTVIASTCGTTLNSKQNCTITLNFTPTQIGLATGTLTVTDSANNSPQTANLSGTGTAE